MDLNSARAVLMMALLYAVPGAASAQCRSVVPEAYEMTTAGRVWLHVSAERDFLFGSAPHTYVDAILSRVDKPGQRPDARILNIWVRRDSTWTALRTQAVNEKTHGLAYVRGLEVPAWDPGTNIDVLTEWQLAGETALHCSLLRSTVTASMFIAPTVILKESIVRDAAGVAKNSGRLVLALRDANEPLVPIIREKSHIVVDTSLVPGRNDSNLQVFAAPVTDVITFDRLPARQVAVTVTVPSKQYFKALVGIVAGCETVMEVYLGPAAPMHSPPMTTTHATVTTCAPVRCLGGNNMVIPCPPMRVPDSPPIVKRKPELR